MAEHGAAREPAAARESSGAERPPLGALRDVWTIAALTVREAYRRFIVTVALVLSAAFLGIYGLGFYYMYRDMLTYVPARSIYTNEGFAFIVMAAFYVVSFLGVMISVLLAVGTLSGEISSHTVQSLAARPIRRGALVLGKWLGLAGLITVFIALLGAGVIAVTRAISGYVPPNPAQGLALIALEALVMLSLTVLGSTRLSTVANGVVAFLLYGLAFVGGWIEQFGALMQSQAAMDIGVMSSLLVPSEAMWKMASATMQTPLMRMMEVGPFTVVRAPSDAMLLYALAYCVLAVAGAVRLFGTRDL